MSVSRDACLEALEEAADELGHAPTVAQYKALDISPSYSTIRARFGSWTTALDHLDVGQQPRSQYSRADCIDALQEAAKELGEEPTQLSYRRLGASPSVQTIQKRFASWRAAKAEADVVAWEVRHSD
jgi:hypothetical protein